MFTQLGGLLDEIDWNLVTISGALFGVVIFQLASIQLGHARMLFAREVLNLDDPPVTRFRTLQAVVSGTTVRENREDFGEA